MIWLYEKKLAQRLIGWGLLSMLAGLVLVLIGSPFWLAFGIQALAWGAVDGLIGYFGLKRVNKQRNQPENRDESQKEAVKLRRLLWINTGLDGLYILGGALLVIALDPGSPFWRGTGWGIILQGAFLFFFDLLHLLGLNKNNN